MLILAVGDTIGKPGRDALRDVLPELRRKLKLDFVIVNAENAAGGVGLTSDTAQDILNAGADVLTSGNHIWRHKEIIPYLDSDWPILRPLNYPTGVPGRGYLVRKGVMVVSLMGRTFIMDIDCPFRAMDKLLSEVKPLPKIIIVDFHAEATSEKVAMGRYLDGRVSAVLGTHTHVGTIDHAVFPKGTAYVTDIGMTGPIESVIGDDIGRVLQRFLTKMPNQLVVGTGPVLFTAMLVDIDETTGQARKIERISEEVA